MNDANDYQQTYYENEWSKIKLSDKPGKSGWRTTVPAPDFVAFVEFLHKNDISGKALDLGCGGGRHSILLAQNGFDVCGIDFADAAINQAKENAQEAGARDHTDFVVGDALKLPYSEQSFDVINDDGCLHHIDPAQWPTYLENVTRVIKKRGTLRIKAFSKNCEYFRQNITLQDSQWVLLKDSGYTYFFTENDIRNLFDTKFEIVKLDENTHTQTSDKKFFFVILKAKTTRYESL